MKRIIHGTEVSGVDIDAETRRRESDALKQTVAAKNETIAAKDAAIAAQDKLIESLRSKKRGIWSRIGDILVGAGVIAVLK